MSESELVSGNITTPLLLIVVVILGISAFFFLELRKIHRKIDALQGQGPPVGPRPGPAPPGPLLPLHSLPITQTAPLRVPEPHPVPVPIQVPAPHPVPVPEPDSESMIRELMEGMGSPQAPVGDLSSLIPPSRGTDTDTEDLTKMTVSQLKTVLQSRKLPTTGNKQKLIRRIQGEDDSPTRSLNVTDALLHVPVPDNVPMVSEPMVSEPMVSEPMVSEPGVREPSKDLNLAHVSRV
jgi:hypothetical protein